MNNELATVMLVDDDDITNLYNKKILEVTSFAKNIVSHQSAISALEYLSRADASQPFPDLIFLDIRMPEMDGFGFLEALDQRKSQFTDSPKVVMLSSLIEDQDRLRAAGSMRVINIIEKPLNEAKLKNIHLDDE